ncbi:MAG: class I SAM-dependent methyltransferase [Alphaproteobacteria bacterium]|nr:MAG: class I SAM-dependent methyltransferase [Alphaproteobacteria bacterium]
MTQALKQKKDWCEEFFDDLFAEHCLMTRSAEEVGGIVSFLKGVLRLKTGDMIFDQCSGVGTLSLALAKSGYRTHGVDLIPAYVAQARREATMTHSACHFAAGDAYTYVPPYACDAALNWWTSFGYTADDAQNIKMLDCAFASLKPDGWFALDYMNAFERLKLLGPTGKTGYRQEKENCIITCDSRLEGKMLVKDWVYTGADGRRVEKRGGGAKLYKPKQLQVLFETAGFRNIRIFGSARGDEFSTASHRCIIVGRKPEA